MDQSEANRGARRESDNSPSDSSFASATEERVVLNTVKLSQASHCHVLERQHGFQGKGKYIVLAAFNVLIRFYTSLYRVYAFNVQTSQVLKQ